MKKLILSLLTSKKFMVSMGGVLAAILVKLGVPSVTAGELAVLIAPFLGYAISQGIGGDRKDAQREAIAEARIDSGIIYARQLTDEARRDKEYARGKGE